MKRIEKVKHIIEAGIFSIHPCNLKDDDGSIYWMSDEEIDMIYDDTIEAQETTTKKEETTMKKLTAEELKTMTMAQISEETTTESENMKDSMDWDYVESELWKRHQMMANKEEQTMKNTNTKEYSFEIRQIDAWYYGEDEGWIWNTSYNMGEMQTKAQNERRAFTAWMKRHLGISFKNNRTLIEYDGDCYTIIDRKTKEPLFIAIPQY